MKILFVCRGNHGRSQMAEGIFVQLSKGEHLASSAGTKVAVPERNMDGQKVTSPFIIGVMKELGVDVSNNIRNQLTPKMVEEADKIVVMAEPETLPEYLKASTKTIYWEVPDPYQQSVEFTRHVRDQLRVLIDDFLKTLNNEKKIKHWGIS